MINGKVQGVPDWKGSWTRERKRYKEYQVGREEGLGKEENTEDTRLGGRKCQEGEEVQRVPGWGRGSALKEE